MSAFRVKVTRTVVRCTDNTLPRPMQYILKVRTISVAVFYVDFLYPIISFQIKSGGTNAGDIKLFGQAEVTFA